MSTASMFFGGASYNNGIVPYKNYVFGEAYTRDGEPANVELGFPSLDDYVQRNEPYLGVLVGRYANRIAGAAFTLDGVEHRLPANDGGSCLHGGAGFGGRVWSIVRYGPAPAVAPPRRWS